MGFFPMRERHSEIGRTSQTPPGLHDTDLLRAGRRHELRWQSCSRDVVAELLRPTPGPMTVRRLGPRGAFRTALSECPE
eukprot:15434754-Alexandrium_andersonii.AAC.1